MQLSREQAQTRFLAIILPALTLSTHLLLSLSSALPGYDRTWPFWSLVYNGTASLASVLGLVGAIRVLPKLVSAYTIVHTATLSFVTLALTNTLLPYDLHYTNPVIPSWRIDESAVCRDISAGFGWDEDWFAQCSTSFGMMQLGVTCGGLVLVAAQWWALFAVRSWSNELETEQLSGDDVEKADFTVEKDGFAVGEKGY
ncbi:uncharacterized protein EKO05_0011461 [Ascochyta rabiei]|uniref:uncharacterized protein n=1 Tax=Didymella rabiei TaxID=5454 RepID=UPI00220D31B1|nr:uncharacterized protein EKO05_0011461 [Ascochyta rabiei]UPX21270.1 hypothetical protein EKO05_0011461 [Ascochyta rabiei]